MKGSWNYEPYKTYLPTGQVGPPTGQAGKAIKRATKIFLFVLYALYG